MRKWFHFRILLIYAFPPFCTKLPSENFNVIIIENNNNFKGETFQQQMKDKFNRKEIECASDNNNNVCARLGEK